VTFSFFPLKIWRFLQFFFPKKVFVQFALGIFPVVTVRKFTTQNKRKKKKRKNCLEPGLFFPQFCDAAEVAIIHKII
jgi:hypothetical protein